MAVILNKNAKRKTIRLSVDDVINVVKAYQTVIYRSKSYSEIRKNLANFPIYLPEDFIY